jgi:peptidoglycan hydrolase-like protein with peptidoglycan-binding domain
MSKKIYINPGHSDIDPGAVGYETERELNVIVSMHMNDYLLANYECETKITPGSMDSLKAICQDANNWGADLFVSNHFNAGRGDGYEALVYSNARSSLGKVFEKHVKAIGQNSRGVKIRSDLYVLKYTNMQAVLNEGAFVDNKKDIQDWNDDAELKKLGIAYAEAAAEYLNLTKKVNKVQSETESYTLTEFIKDVQKSIGAVVDGIAGPQTLSKTLTISSRINYKHVVVKYIQKRLYELGYTEVGTADGIAGSKFTSAVAHFQQDNDCYVDGVITAKNKTWKKLLGMA